MEETDDMEEIDEKEGVKRSRDDVGEKEMPKEKRRRSARIAKMMAKRQRDAEQEQLHEQEEFDARGVSVVNLRGPPWYDEYTGERLPDEE
eukprot:868978-Heterocapsa_arctica.AAC.1